MPTPRTSASLLVQLLHDAIEPIDAAVHLAALAPEALDYLQAKANDLHNHAISEARDLLDVVLESLEHPLSQEHQRCLIERADDELSSAQRWGELATNARFCREHPELARQLAGDAAPNELPAATSSNYAKDRRGGVQTARS